MKKTAQLGVDPERAPSSRTRVTSVVLHGGESLECGDDFAGSSSAVSGREADFL